MSTKAPSAYQLDYVRMKNCGAGPVSGMAHGSHERVSHAGGSHGCTMSDAYYFFHQVHKYPKVSAVERRVNRMSPEDRQMVGTANTTVGSTKRKLVW